jgi:hypothetical protein
LIVGIAFAGSGGPDGGGYYWFDQDYNSDWFSTYWNDIYVSGDILELGDDNYVHAGSISFNFNFYGSNYTEIYVGSNGTIYFVDEYLGYSNVDIPGNNIYGVSTFIAPFWTDLNLDSGGNVYFEEFEDHFIVMWRNVRDFGDHYITQFEVICWESINDELSDIILLYNFSGTDEACSIGIQENESTGTGLEYNPVTVDIGDVYYFSGDPQLSVVNTSLGSIKALFKD